MREKSFSNMLLFSKEVTSYPYKYRLYFIDTLTMRDEEPVIHRFCVKRGKAFDKFELGGIYDLSAKKLFIKESKLLQRADIDEDLYQSLVYLRDLIFMDKNSGKYIGLQEEGYNSEDYYYSFKDCKELITYKPAGSVKAIYILMKLALYFVAVVIPIALYLLLLYALSTIEGIMGIVAIPAMALLSLPLIIWIMNFLFVTGESMVMLSHEAGKIQKKKYALKWAGMRRTGSLGKKTKKELLKSFIVAAVCMVLGVIIIFVF